WLRQAAGLAALKRIWSSFVVPRAELQPTKSTRDTAHLGHAGDGLHFRNGCQNDHRLAGLIFGSRSDLIAGQIESNAVALIGGCKMQRYPANDDPSIPHAEKTTEIDHGGAYLPPLIDQDVDDPAQVFPGAAADLFAEHP